MNFGLPTEFGIEVYHEPYGPEWMGFGRMCIHIQGVQIGDLYQNHCSLFHATDQIRKFCTCLESLWEESFAGLTDIQIFAALDDALYLGEESKWERYGRFDFLTNTGEQFDCSKTFLFCRPEKRVHILYRLRDDSRGSGSCSAECFRSVAKAYLTWFDDQVRNPPAEFFPINPFDPDEVVPE